MRTEPARSVRILGVVSDPVRRNEGEEDAAAVHAIQTNFVVHPAQLFYFTGITESTDLLSKKCCLFAWRGRKLPASWLLQNCKWSPRRSLPMIPPNIENR